VLCDLHRKETGEGSWDGQKYVVSEEEWDASLLPHTVRQWAGMATQKGTLCIGRSLSGMNDTGVGFDQLAEFIAAGEVM